MAIVMLRVVVAAAVSVAVVDAAAAAAAAAVWPALDKSLSPPARLAYLYCLEPVERP